jgi:hypothetical protein
VVFFWIRSHRYRLRGRDEVRGPGRDAHWFAEAVIRELAAQPDGLEKLEHAVEEHDFEPRDLARSVLRLIERGTLVLEEEPVAVVQLLPTLETKDED